MPAQVGVRAGKLAFAIDCSGSTSDAMVGQCGAEVKRAMDAHNYEEIHVIYFDRDIKKVEVFRPDDEIVVKVYGRGGTAFSPIFKYIADNEIEPEACIVATDLYCHDYGPEPDYPVIWCVMDGAGHTPPPFGRVIDTGAVDANDFDTFDFDDDYLE